MQDQILKLLGNKKYVPANIPQLLEALGYEKTGGGFVTPIVRGDVAAVKAAIDAGVRSGEKVGEVISTHVIARPHLNVDVVLPLGRSEEAEGELG